MLGRDLPTTGLLFYPNCRPWVWVWLCSACYLESTILSLLPGPSSSWFRRQTLLWRYSVHLVILWEPLFSRFRFPFTFLMFHRITCPRAFFSNCLSMNSRKSTVFHCSCIYAYSTHMQIVWPLSFRDYCFLAIYICFLNYQLLPVSGLGRVNFWTGNIKISTFYAKKC